MPGSRLCVRERQQIRDGLTRDESLSAIGRRLGRAPSTICREVAANGPRADYVAADAQLRADRAARRPKPFKFVVDADLAKTVETALKTTRYSPKAISVQLAKQDMNVSAETIYQACYDPSRGLNKDLWKCLPRRRQKRKHAGRAWRSASGNPLGEPVSIHHRHPIALERIQPGHLEGDLIIGARNQSAILTLCEPLTHYTWLAALPNGYGIEPVAHALYDLLTIIPPPMRRTLTWDQGREMGLWATTQTETGTPIYFADPHSPWQRPTVENNNGILRRWLPKGTDLTHHTQTDLDHITHLINNMPRPTHNWQTANDLYTAHIVATTT